MARTQVTPEEEAKQREAARSIGLAQRALDDALAAEFVLDLVDPDERAEADRRLRHDPAFAARVAVWKARMSEPSFAKARPASADQQPSWQGPAATRQPRAVRRAAALSGVPGFLAGAAVALALVLGTISIVTPPHPGVIVRLATPDDRLIYEIARFGASLKVTRVAGAAAPTGKVHQLWLIPPGQAPVALGLLEGHSLMIDRPAPTPGARFAVSLEPGGGAVGGRPSGPMILMTGIGD